MWLERSRWSLLDWDIRCGWSFRAMARLTERHMGLRNGSASLCRPRPDRLRRSLSKGFYSAPKVHLTVRCRSSRSAMILILAEGGFIRSLVLIIRTI